MFCPCLYCWPRPDPGLPYTFVSAGNIQLPTVSPIADGHGALHLIGLIITLRDMPRLTSKSRQSLQSTCCRQ